MYKMQAAFNLKASCKYTITRDVQGGIAKIPPCEKIWEIPPCPAKQDPQSGGKFLGFLGIFPENFGGFFGIFGEFSASILINNRIQLNLTNFRLNLVKLRQKTGFLRIASYTLYTPHMKSFRNTHPIPPQGRYTLHMSDYNIIYLLIPT